MPKIAPTALVKLVSSKPVRSVAAASFRIKTKLSLIMKNDSLLSLFAEIRSWSAA